MTLGHRDNSMENRDQEAPQREVRGFIHMEPESVLLGDVRSQAVLLNPAQIEILTKGCPTEE